ncbi:glycosyltransferase family 4 protein [Pedobacter glucosidilyticus]|uniref:glycosyltransferase family 4 protein n=1 Tax=Pedobacter glucosidilyticus TaxID=1122941 RepID=UPI0026F313DA|nr:glycosyltransferase family 4 protein [Pedobacter glucosidilyticus]
MTITFILPEITGGGIATYYKNLIPQLVEAGHAVNVILGDYKFDIAQHSFPGQLFQITKQDYKKGLAQYTALDIFSTIRHKCALSYACYLRALEMGSDVIEITDYNLLFYKFLTDKIAPVVIRLAGSSGQLELHEQRNSDQLENTFLLGLEKSLINEADYIIGLSQLNVDYWNQRLNNKSFLHLPYINYKTTHVTPTEIKSNRGVVVGRLQLWKGAKFLCEFYQKYPDAPEVDWIGGDNYYKDYAVSMLAHLKKTYPDIIGHKIHFIGRLPYEKTQQKITDAAFVLVPSIWDTFNFVVTEAMWNKKIVITSDGTGASELIDNDNNGFVYNHKDVHTLADSLKRFQSKSALELEMIASNAQKTVKYFLNNPQLITDRLNIYDSLKNLSIKRNEEIAFLNQALTTPSTKKAVVKKLSAKELLQAFVNKITR